MLHDHQFSGPASKRSSNFIGRNWLLLAVLSLAVALLASGFLGVSPRSIRVGSTMLSGFVLSYTFFVLIRSRRRLNKLNAKIDLALAEVAPRKRTSNSQNPASPE